MNEISILKFIATILITNSHFGVLYPQEFQYLATGGTIGNSLFFFISGYTLYLSNKDSFYKWITKRYIRIYLPVWIFNLVTIVFFQKWNIIDFVLPNYWFLRAILLFYLVYFFLIKYFENRFGLIFIIVIVAYLITYFLNATNSWVVEITNNSTYLHWYYYFGLMLFGALIAKNKKNKIHYNSFINFWGLLIFVVLYYVSKHIILNFNLFQLQFLLPIYLFFICFFAYSCCLITISLPKSLNNIIVFVSGLTLEIYIVQFIIIRSLVNIHFPLNTLFSVVLIVFSAYILNLSSKKLNIYR